MIKAIIMLGAAKNSAPERLLLDAQRAATLDLIALIQRKTSLPVLVSSPELDWLPDDLDVERVIDAPEQDFHFGEHLARFIEAYDLERVMYFGGGSAPLLDSEAMSMINGLLMMAGTSGSIPSQIVLTNNRHSSDWAAISGVQAGLAAIRSVKHDNNLAWTLQQTGDYDVRVLSGLRPATSMDLDTPSDLAIVAHHPDCPAHLRKALNNQGLDQIPVLAVLDVLKRTDAQVTLIGRVSPLAWQALSKVTRSGIRVVAEEHRLVASDHRQSGKVQSMLIALLQSQGIQGFFQTLASLSDAAIIDSRVIMAAHYGHMPAATERFASDWYDLDSISDPWLREFTQAAQEAPIPIISGGHNVVTGGLYAMAEMIEKGVS